MIKLYQRDVCPDSAVIRQWLGQHNISYEILSVPKMTSQRKELISLAGTGIVPVLHDGDMIITDSSKILSYLREKYGSSNYGDPGYGLTMNIGKVSFEEAIEKVIASFKKAEFGLQTEMNLQETFKKKINVDFKPYRILGFCHPAMAYQAVQEEPGIGLLLPCNVVITEEANKDIIISAIDPMKLFTVVGREDIKPMAKEIKLKMGEALKALEV